MKETREITIDDRGNSPIVAIDGEEGAECGPYGEFLTVGSVVDIEDGTTWVVQRVYSYIHTAPMRSNYVYVDLVAE